MKTLSLKIIIIVSISLTSCAYFTVPKHIKQGFTYCYDGKNTGIKSLLNIDGYYVIPKPYDKYGKNAVYMHEIDTFYLNLMFFEDGIFVDNFYDCNSERLMKNEQNIPLYFKEIAEDKKATFYQSFNWGCYIISRDTIKVQFLNHPALLSPTWTAFEIWYKVIDRNTIIEIDSKPIHYMTKSDWDNNLKYKKERKIYPARFIPVDVMPSSDCWLKKKEWFWCKNRN